MARLMEKGPLVEKCAAGGGGGGRKLSFKTKAQTSERRNYRATKVTVPSSSVAELASKFNAVIVEEPRRQEILRILKGNSGVPGNGETVGPTSNGAVKAAIKAFENQQPQPLQPRPKVVLVRKQSFLDKQDHLPSTKETVQSLPPVIHNNSTDESVKKPSRPKIQPKPEYAVLERRTSLSFKGPRANRPYKLEPRDLSVKDKKLSIPKDQTILESVLNECTTPEVKEPMVPNNSFLWRPKTETNEEQDKENRHNSEDQEKENIINVKEPENDEVQIKEESNKVNLEKDVNQNPTLNHGIIIIPEKTEDLKPQANLSSLYKNIKNSNKDLTKTVEVLKEVVENEASSEESQPVKEITNKSSDIPQSPICQSVPQKVVSEPLSDYEDIGGFQLTNKEESNNYEDVNYGENNYAVINGYESDEPLYDDVNNVKTGSDYERVYYPVHIDSDSSWDHSNSLYGVRPSSRTSSVSGAVQSGASRSDTSDDWVDVEPEELNVEKQEEIVLVQERTRCRGSTSGWSQKVRRQWSKRLDDSERFAITSTSSLYFTYSESSYDDDKCNTQAKVESNFLFTKGLVSLRTILYFGSYHETQEVSIFLNSEGDSDSEKLYEAVGNHDEDSAVYDDFDGSSDSASSGDEGKVRKPIRNGKTTPTHSERIYELVLEAGRQVRKPSSWIGKSLRRISKINQAPSSDSADYQNVNLSRGRWPSFKKFNKGKLTATFYLKDESDMDASDLKVNVPESRTESVVETRRLSRPSSPPPPPPPMRPSGESKKKPINDTTWYWECGLFDSSTNGESKRHPPSSNSWYCDVGLYDKNKPSDTASEHSSSQGSDLNLRFADEPLYQFYAATVAQMECNEYDSGSDCYEEIGDFVVNKPEIQRPSVLDLPATGIHRTLWSQVPQVVSSGILDKLTTAEQKLQEAKFELVTSEASYYKSLTILEKHFALNAFMKDETVLPKVDYKILFSNIAPVRKCSESVLAALDKCWQDNIMMDGICGIIHQLSQQHFHVYIKYCTNQVLIESTLKRLKQSHSLFAETLNALENSKKCQSLSLYSFLLLPMQRITRMPLLLDAIRTKLDPDTNEYESCTLALAQLQKIAHECDEAAKKAERYEEMALLSRVLNYPTSLRPLPLLSASRWLERSGQVTHINMEAKLTFGRKLTARNAKLTLFLFTDYLIISKKKSEENFSVVDYCPRNLVQVSKVEDAIPTKFLIELIMLQNHEGKTQTMMLCCGSESSRERWLQAFSSPHSSNSEETLYADWDCPQVAATHAYVSSQPDELALQHGDVVNVFRKLNDGWYYGERIRDGEKGWFPGNYTTEIASLHVRARNLKLRYRLLALSADYLDKKNKNSS